MSTELEAAAPRSRLRAALPWVVSTSVLAGVVAAIALTGGFGRTAPAFIGSEYAVGEVVPTRLWDVAVDGAEMSPEEGKVFVHVVATNLQRDSAFDLTTNMVVVLLPDGTAMWRSSCLPVDRSSFGPDVATRAVCEFGYEQNEVPAPQESATMDITVVVTDQTMTDALLHAPTPEAGEPVGWVAVTATLAAVEP